MSMFDYCDTIGFLTFATGVEGWEVVDGTVLTSTDEEIRDFTCGEHSARLVLKRHETHYTIELRYTHSTVRVVTDDPLVETYFTLPLRRRSCVGT